MDTSSTIAQFAKMLDNLDRWLEASAAFATGKGFEVDVLAASRLAPDQFNLVQQVQSACDAAKFAAAYLSGQTAPSHPDTETTIAELRDRVRTCVAYVRGVPASQFDGAADRRVSPAWMQGKWVRGDDYLTGIAVPNFYFHVVTAYAILRHNGVALGKMDFIGGIEMKDA